MRGNDAPKTSAKWTVPAAALCAGAIGRDRDTMGG